MHPMHPFNGGSVRGIVAKKVPTTLDVKYLLNLYWRGPCLSVYLEFQLPHTKITFPYFFGQKSLTHSRYILNTWCIFIFCGAYLGLVEIIFFSFHFFFNFLKSRKPFHFIKPFLLKTNPFLSLFFCVSNNMNAFLLE